MSVKLNIPEGTNLRTATGKTMAELLSISTERADTLQTNFSDRMNSICEANDGKYTDIELLNAAGETADNASELAYIINGALKGQHSAPESLEDFLSMIKGGN